MTSPFARALHRLTTTGRFTVEELADAGGVSPRHLYNVRTGEAKLSEDAAALICHYLCRHGETAGSRAYVCAEYEIVRRDTGRADGRIDDEMRDLMICAGAAAEAYTRSDVEAMDRHLSDFDAVRDRMRAERDRIA